MCMVMHARTCIHEHVRACRYMHKHTHIGRYIFIYAYLDMHTKKCARPSANFTLFEITALVSNLEVKKLERRG